MIAISSRSWLANSARPPLSYNSTDSWRCLIIFWNTPSRSASDSGGLPSPRAAMSAFLMVELTIRSVESLRSSLAFIASLTALLMSSRSMGISLLSAETVDLGRSPHRDNRPNHETTAKYAENACESVLSDFDERPSGDY